MQGEFIANLNHFYITSKELQILNIYWLKNTVLIIHIRKLIHYLSAKIVI